MRPLSLRAQRARAPKLLLAGVLLLALVAAEAGCGGTSKASTPAALKLQREDLVATSRALKRVEHPVAREVAASKAAWPLIATGLPSNIATVSRSPRVRAATASAAELRLPALFGEAQVRRLTGPASQIAGLFRSYALLSARGWKLLDASMAQIEHGAPTGARFARENAPLYIESVYDAHFTVAQIGKKLRAAYDKLGGAGEFGATLTETEVDALIDTYSEAGDRLYPHVTARLGS